MGTSQSNPGPGGKSPLVPSWADDQPQQPLATPESARFKPFRQALGKFLSSGDRKKLESALGHYARKSTGGSGNASRRMGSVIQAGGSLFHALTSGESFGQPGETSVNLSELAGLPCDQAIGIITQALVTTDGDADKIRAAMNHALAGALNDIETFDPSCITDDVIVDTMIGYLSESIFLQIVMDAGKTWNKSDTSAQALRAESDLKEIVKVEVGKYMAAQFAGKIRTFTKTEVIQLERQVIVDVWRDWESYR
jgi:hypothetical protein